MTSIGLKVGFSVAHASSVAGGISEVLHGLGLALVEAGAEVRIFAGQDSNLAAGTPFWKGLQTDILKTAPPRQFGYQRGLADAVTRWKADTLHVHGLWMYPSWATRHWRRLGIPYVVAPHGMIDRWALRNSQLKKRLALAAFERASLEGAACLHVLNEAELSAVRDAGFANSVAVINNGTELPERYPLRVASNGLRTLLYIGRLHPKKGLVELLLAFAQTRAALPNWRLIIAGWDDGGYLHTLKEMRNKLDLGNDVHFSGPVFGAQKDELFRMADSFVLPSKSEGMPMAVLEAWSYGLPVLMTPECNLRHGFSVGAAQQITCSPDALAAELIAFCQQSPDALVKAGARGRALVEARYQWAAIARQTIALHMWISGRAERPDFVCPVRGV